MRVGINDTPGCYGPGATIPAVSNVGFREYVMSVLPGEWSPGWDMKALQAGAMAIKDYSWYRVNNPLFANADLDDTTCTQTISAHARTTSTDEAVNSTFADGYYQDGHIFLAQYISGTQGSVDPCLPDGTCYWGRMSQWGSQELALQGKTYREIVEHYYGPHTNPTYGGIISYFTVVPQSNTIYHYPSSIVPGQSATFTYDTPGAVSYEVERYNYQTQAWSLVYSGANSTITIGPANDGTQRIRLRARGYNLSGWGDYAHNNGWGDVDVTSNPLSPHRSAPPISPTTASVS